MAQLQLRLLGAPEIHHGEHALTFPTRRSLALLAYLATERGPHRREKLAALFWPDSDDRTARATLRSTLARLRDTLGELDPAPHVAVERDAIRFNPASDHESDLHRLAAAHNLARRLATIPAGEARRVAAAQVQHAVDLWRGEFLEGFSLRDAPEFDEWLALQREGWRRRLVSILDHLSQAQAEEGLLTAGLDAVGRWIALDPLDERAHRRLIELHLATGNRVAALRAYHACRAVLAKELGAEPAPETEALARRLQVAPPSRNAASSDARAPLPLPLFLQAPLAGRTKELMKLVELHHTARGGRPQVVVLVGEAGIGKTRLATEFLAWAAAQGADIVHGRAFETGGRLPYQPLVDALRPRVERENAPADLLDDVWLAELSRLLPELRERYPDLPSSLGDDTAARTRLYEAVARLGQALAERTPLVFFIDDVQWADAASMDVLRYVGRRWAEAGARVFLLLGLRSEALATATALDDWLAGLRRDIPTTDLPLGPLSPQEAAQLLHGLGVEEGASLSTTTAPASDAPFTRWLFAETRGQPFFMVETLRALLERGLAVPRLREDGSWAIDIPPDLAEGTTPPSFVAPGVREVVRGRLAHLDLTAQTLLTAAAVLGQGFTFEQMCQVAGLSEDTALPALDNVLRGNLLREVVGEDSGAPAGAYSFSHDKIRDVVYTEAGDARRRVFHRRALETLKSARAPAAELAHHALAAGLAEPALFFHLAAGDQAMHLLAARDAAAHYGQALTLAERLGRSDLLPEIHARRGRAFASVAMWTEAKCELEAALARVGEEHEVRRAELLVDLLEVYWWLLDVPAMRRLAHEAIALATRLGRGDLETAAIGWLAGAEGADGDLSACLEQSNRTLRRAAELRIPPPPHVQTHHSLALYWLGRADQAIEVSREAVQAAREASDIPVLMYSLAHLGLGLAAAGRYTEAVQRFEELRQLGRDHGIGTLLARSIAMSAGFHLDLFDFAGAEALAREARGLALSLGFLPPAVSSGIDLLLNFARRGEVARAEALLGEVSTAAAGAAGFHGWLWSLRLAQARAEIALARGDWEEAQRWANEALEQSRARGRVKYQVLALVTRAGALRALGHSKAAIDDLQRAVDLARSIGDSTLFLRATAALLALDGQDALAVEARAAVDRIARALPDAELRRTFEFAEPVRLVLRA